MTPEEYQQILASQQVRPRRRNGMWALVRDNGFMFGDSPFDASSPFDLDSPFNRDSSPFFPKRRRL